MFKTYNTTFSILLLLNFRWLALHHDLAPDTSKDPGQTCATSLKTEVIMLQPGHSSFYVQSLSRKEEARITAENIPFLHLDIPKGKSPSSVSFSCLFPACYFPPFIAISSVSCHRSSSCLPLSLPATQLYTWDLLECPPFIILSHHFIISSPSHQTSSLIFQI